MIDMSQHPHWRRPYVGDVQGIPLETDIDGCYRSAEIDRSEADGYDPGPDRDRCLSSAERWEAQAREVEALWLNLDGPNPDSDPDLGPGAGPETDGGAGTDTNRQVPRI